MKSTSQVVSALEKIGWGIIHTKLKRQPQVLKGFKKVSLVNGKVEDCTENQYDTLVIEAMLSDTVLANCLSDDLSKYLIDPHAGFAGAKRIKSEPFGLFFENGVVASSPLQFTERLKIIEQCLIRGLYIGDILVKNTSTMNYYPATWDEEENAVILETKASNKHSMLQRAIKPEDNAMHIFNYANSLGYTLIHRKNADSPWYLELSSKAPDWAKDWAYNKNSYHKNPNNRDIWDLLLDEPIYEGARVFQTSFGYIYTENNGVWKLLNDPYGVDEYVRDEIQMMESILAL